MKTLTRLTILSLLTLLIMLVASVCHAQDTNSVPVTPPAVTHFFEIIKPFEFLLIPIVTVFIQLVRKFVPQIPSGVWPYAAPFIGALLDWLATKMGLWSGNPMIGAMLGGLATWFHQADKQGPDVLSKMLPEGGTQ